MENNIKIIALDDKCINHFLYFLFIFNSIILSRTLNFYKNFQKVLKK